MPSPTDNPLGLKRFHHIEIITGNARQSAHYYRKAFGFSQLAYRGLETGATDVTSYVLSQRRVRFILSTPMHSEHPYNGWLRRHGDGVRDIAIEVKDVDHAFSLAVERGAQVVAEPHDVEDAHGAIRKATIHTYGDTVHTFLEYKGYEGAFLPGFTEARIDEPEVGLLAIDHIVGNVELGKMQEWAGFYERVMGFHRYITFDDKDISTEYTALMSIVMSSDNYAIKFPINEPAPGKKKSQIEEYIDFNEGAGVQHVAMLTKDIVATIRALRARGVEFLFVPPSYYDDIPTRVGAIDEALDELSPLGILIDRDDEGYLMQLFTRPVQDRPTLFFEIIQRKGAKGFGKGNFKALFESIEREQERRGTL